MEGERALRIAELISTELSYIDEMEALQAIFVVPLTSPGKKGKSIISREEKQAIFSNLDTILNINAQLQCALAESCMNCEVQRVGQAFLSMAEYFKAYSFYCAGLPESIATIERLTKENSAFRKFKEAAFNNPRSQCLPLESHLIKPIQRICKYPLLLKEIFKVTPEGHVDRDDLAAAIEHVVEIVDYVNEKKRQSENQTKIVTLMKKMENLKISLLSPGREYVRHKELGIIQLKKVERTKKGMKKNEVEKLVCFLFNDMLLMMKPRGKSLTRPWMMEFLNCRLVLSSSLELEHMFQLEDTRELGVFIYCVVFHGESERDVWYGDIKRYIKEVQKRRAFQSKKEHENFVAKKKEREEKKRALNKNRAPIAPVRDDDDYYGAELATVRPALAGACEKKSKTVRCRRCQQKFMLGKIKSKCPHCGFKSTGGQSGLLPRRRGKKDANLALSGNMRITSKVSALDTGAKGVVFSGAVSGSPRARRPPPDFTSSAPNPTQRTTPSQPSRSSAAISRQEAVPNDDRLHDTSISPRNRSRGEGSSAVPPRTGPRDYAGAEEDMASSIASKLNIHNHDIPLLEESEIDSLSLQEKIFVRRAKVNAGAVSLVGVTALGRGTGSTSRARCAGGRGVGPRSGSPPVPSMYATSPTMTSGTGVGRGTGKTLSSGESALARDRASTSGLSTGRGVLRRGRGRGRSTSGFTNIVSRQRVASSTAGRGGRPPPSSPRVLAGEDASMTSVGGTVGRRRGRGRGSGGGQGRGLGAFYKLEPGVLTTYEEDKEAHLQSLKSSEGPLYFY